MKVHFLGLVLFTTMAIGQERLDSKRFANALNTTHNAILLDVRTPAETEKGYIKGAIFMDFYAADFKQQLKTLDKNAPIFIYCAAGGRSLDAMNILLANGYKKVYDLEGGMIDWKMNNLPWINLSADKGRKGMSKASFEKSIANQQIVFVDFFAPWCAPCKIMVPALDTLRKDFANKATIIKINTDENLQLLKEYNIRSIPFVMILKNGKIVFQKSGFMSLAEMKKELKKFF